MNDRYPLEGLIALHADKHRAEESGMGCTCGFGVWSPEHVAIMAYREAEDARPIGSRWSTVAQMVRDDMEIVGESAEEVRSLRPGEAEGKWVDLGVGASHKAKSASYYGTGLTVHAYCGVNLWPNRMSLRDAPPTTACRTCLRLSPS